MALEVEHLSGQYSLLNDVSFNVRKGEIIGLAGLDGSGRTEVLENLFGIATRKSGMIRLDGKQVLNRNARESIKNGFALLTEERRATGIFGILDIRENTVISNLKNYRSKAFPLMLDDKKMRQDTQCPLTPCIQRRYPGNKNPQSFRRKPAEGYSGKMASYKARGAASGTSLHEEST